MIEISNLKKEYKTGGGVTAAVNGISLKIPEGKFVSIIGPSGAGKSTLLRLINGMLSADEGSVCIDGKNITELKGRAKRDVQKNICMIFQDFCLVGNSTVKKNVLNACLGNMNLFSVMFGFFGAENNEKAEKILGRVGMANKSGQMASVLSGGERQRTAIARALMQGGRILLADEPVASLDPVNAEAVLELLKALQTEKNMTVVMNSHNIEQAVKYSDWIIGINSGRVVYEGEPKNMDNSVRMEIYGKDS